MKPYLAAFVSVFLAELGDKASALTMTTVIAVVAGDQIGRLVQPATLRVLAGVGFVAIGVWLVAVR